MGQKGKKRGVEKRKGLLHGCERFVKEKAEEGGEGSYGGCTMNI